LLDAPLLQQLPRWQDQRVRRERRAQPVKPEIRARTQTGAVKKMKSGPRNKDEQKIRESLKLELEIATKQAVQTANMSLQLKTEERAASGTNALAGVFSSSPDSY
jgi:hypothetical protein